MAIPQLLTYSKHQDILSKDRGWGEVLTSKYSLHSTSMGCQMLVYIECYLWHYESEYNRYFNIRQLVSVFNPITE